MAWQCITDISDFHERRLNEVADRIADEAKVERRATFVCDVTSEEAVQGLRDASLAALDRGGTEQIQCNISSEPSLGLSEEPRGK